MFTTMQKEISKVCVARYEQKVLLPLYQIRERTLIQTGSVRKRSFLQLSLTLYLRRNLKGEIHFLGLMRKESIRRKIKKDPSGSLQRKYKFMRSEVKKLLRESREKFFQSVDNSFKVNPKRFWSVLTHKNKSCSIPNQISVPVRLFDGPCSLHSDPSDEKLRTTATNPAQIASFLWVATHARLTIML